MAYGTGQVAGMFPPYSELMTEAEAQTSQKIIALTKIGIQLEKNKRIFLDEKEFKIGKTGKLEFDNVYLTSIKPANEISNNGEEDLTTPMFIILDYVYLDEEE